MDESIASTIATYGSVAEQYCERHADRTTIRPLLDRFLDAVTGARVLDVGCGPGWETETFAQRGYDPIGVDLTPAFLRLANEQTATGRFARMDMRQLGVMDGSIDGLWACASFLHIPRSDAPATLAEFHRALRSGPLALAVKRGEGTMVGTTYVDDTRRFTLYTREEITDRVTEAGFTIEYMTVDDNWIQCVALA
ncbi:class I SAM-dependent methyltransferase [Halocatena pleomorpha]|uniref:Class I SAM-dependent methyltransferase n=1 Tax=Halocatena pleomorpha TaxID=1785090 RepID=A0A3P3RBM6_9EURY|nr:class I SAM-dependent methyltransferase [Halocatena pleomorpha]RRJ30379.1 class I SAM-dependent methyltransferase [Halocatena pleomorpha]